MAPLTYFFRLYISIYPKNIREHNRSGVPPPEASVATENQSRPIQAPCRRGQRSRRALIRLQRIYNFLLLHAILSTVLDYIGLYFTLLYYFRDYPINPRPSANCCFFCLFQCFEEKEYQTESKRNETFGRIVFGTNAIQETWSGVQGSNEAATR